MDDNRDPIRLHPGNHEVTFWVGQGRPTVQVDVILYGSPSAHSGHGDVSREDIRRLRDALSMYLDEEPA